MLHLLQRVCRCRCGRSFELKWTLTSVVIHSPVLSQEGGRFVFGLYHKERNRSGALPAAEVCYCQSGRRQVPVHIRLQILFPLLP